MSPFEPPKANVEVADRGAGIPKPVQVRWAVGLFWASLATSIPGMFFEAAKSQADGGLGFFLAFSAVFVALAVTLIIYIDRGRNWARITMLILMIVFTPLWFAQSEPAPGPQPLIDGLTYVGFVLDIVGLYFLFTRPGALWFRRL
ncbi:MAG: hypothetical protein JNM79_09530 [Burkholderiales bacterium]|nr:hypothetical protein [Burkholderiales bacterium]